MPVTFEILTDPIGSQFTQSIGADDPDDLNDFSCFIVASNNTTGLTIDDLSVSEGEVISVEGENSVYRAVVRPPESSEVITFTIAADAVTEGNDETDIDIRVSTAFPDDDAEMPTALFDPTDNYTAIAVTPTRILLGRRNSSVINITKFEHDGTEDTTLTASGLNNLQTVRSLDYINGDILIRTDETTAHAIRFLRYDLSDGALRFAILGSSVDRSITHTRLGYIINRNTTVFRILPYGSESATDIVEIDATDIFPSPVFVGDFENIAHQNDLLYLMGPGDRKSGLAEIIDATTINFVRQLNIEGRSSASSTFRDVAVYRDTLYFISNDGVFTLDIRPYRPMAKNTKTTIYPVFANEGDTIDLTQYAPDAEKIIFDEGFDKPDYLSINASNELVIASNAVTETTPVLVRCRGINYIDSAPFSFYLIIQPAENPVWRDVDELTMRAGSSYDLNALIEKPAGLQTPPTLTFRSGRTQPTGSSLSDGVFTIGTQGGTTYVTATNDNGSTHFEIEILVLQTPNPDNFSDTFRHKVYIAGIDVTSDVIVFPRISGSLDDRRLNEYRADNLTLTLRSDDANAYKYNDGIADNFWETHTLNAAGFREPVKVFFESLVDGDWVSTLMFSGRVLNANANLDNTAFQMTCSDLTKDLQNELVQGFGTLEKWDALRQQSDEATYQGSYMPESALLPMQTFAGEIAWTDRQKLTLRQIQIPPEGIPPENEAYLTADALFTAGGFLDAAPLLKFKGQPRAEEVPFLFHQLALNKTIYNAEIDVPAQILDDPFILNRGSVPFSVEDTRNTRLVTDWVHDATNERVLMPLSNPEGHIADLLVQYAVEIDSYRVLHVFGKNLAVHRIERRNATNYYLLTSGVISQDRSAQTLPRHSDRTAYAYDAIAEGSEIKIYHYNASTGALTEHVAEDNARPPQLGVHYHAGFENTLYIDEFEGIVSEYRGAFKVYSDDLYYRYATDAEFGVARVNTSGTTSEMIDQARGNYWNHLNFAFDINTSNGDLYFVYMTGDTETSTLTIKRRTSGGTESTIFTETRGVGDFNDVGLDFGAFLGCYEALFHDDNLHLLVPIQKADFGDDAQSIINPDVDIEQLTAEKTGERNVTTSTNLNPSNQTLAPGDDIPLRIDFDGTVTGATQSDLTVYGGTIESFSISSDMIDVTITPDSQTRHKTIIIDLAEDAVDQTNEAWRITIDFETTRSREKTAGMVLYRCDVTAASPSLTVIEKWDFVQLGGCNLCVHSGSVHYMEHPPASAIYRPINPDLDGYWTDAEESQTLGYNTLPESIGALKKVNASGEVESLGNLRYDGDRAYNVATTRCLSFDDDLHATMGYGDIRGLLKRDALASQADNAQHLVYGNKLRYIVPAFEANRSKYASLAELALKINATLFFANGLICIKDRNPFRAECDGATGTGTGNLDFDSENKTFPMSGYLKICTEILAYTGVSSGAFTGITRGVLGTEIANHANNSNIVYLDNVIEPDRIKQNGFSISTDTTRVFNAIRNSDNSLEVCDPDSIAVYGELTYPLDLGLTQHELPWQGSVSEQYLENLKDPHAMIRLTLKPTNYLEAAQVVGVRREGIPVYAVQIVSLTKGQTATEVRGRAV